MEEVKFFIKTLLPTISEEVLEKVVALLEELGVSDVHYLDLVQESDLTPALKKIEVRLLVREWRKNKKDDESTNENSSPTIIATSVPKPVSCTSTASIIQKPSNLKNLAFNPQKYEVPWESMPHELRRCLIEKTRPLPSLRNQMVRVIVDNMHKIIEKPGRKALDVVAAKIIEKYPQSFADDIGIDINGLSHLSLSKQLEVRFDNINRNSPINILKRKSKHENKISKKIKLADCYGCVGYQPKLPLTETNQSQMEKREKMKSYASINQAPLTEEWRKLLMETYCSIREDINSLKELDFLIAEWPLLFTKEGFFDHFEELVGVNIENTLSSSFSKLGITIFNYFLSEPKLKPSIKTANKDKLNSIIRQLKSEPNENLYTWLNLINLLMAYLEEDMKTLFIIVEAAVTVGEVEMVIPITPCIICCGEHMNNLSTFMLAIDSKIILQDIKTFEESLALLFSSYYCLNIQYPSSAGATLECIQRCFLNVNPLKGSKSDGKNCKSVHPKIVSLKKTIADFQWNL